MAGGIKPEPAQGSMGKGGRWQRPMHRPKQSSPVWPNDQHAKNASPREPQTSDARIGSKLQVVLTSHENLSKHHKPYLNSHGTPPRQAPRPPRPLQTIQRTTHVPPHFSGIAAGQIHPCLELQQNPDHP